MQTTATFHDGELAVQRRAGVEDTAAKVGRIIASSIPPEFAAFVERRPFLVVGRVEGDGRMWASLVAGAPGFARALDDRRLLIAAPPFCGTGAAVGILAIEPHTRSRIRLNGIAELTPAGVLVTVTEAFGNCYNHIRRRLPAAPLAATVGEPRTGARVDASGRALIAAADTFFIATSHPERGADASHRGGPPGFVRVAADGSRLRFPDYLGNRMFQTLGNLVVDPRAGLLFVDWSSGSTLELSGRAQVAWDGTEREVEVEIEMVRERPGALGACWAVSER